jgi:Protein of unknown function (DUF3040)
MCVALRRRFEKGGSVPLSEDEQRILHEMEQKLYEGERAFTTRVRTPSSAHRRPLRWSAVIFVVGFAVIVLSFRSSLLLATFGFLVMVLAALSFDRNIRQVFSTAETSASSPPRKPSGDLAGIGRRFRSRFFQQH